MNYYNEFEPSAAAWLRQLISDGLIPAGHVDTRSIRDVRADDLRGYAQCHFFAGIGGWSLALDLVGWPEDRPVWTGSCPCQPFSIAGKGLGTADERHLWPVFADLIKECRPPVVFGEQVASAAGRKWLAGVRADLEGMGYAVGGADLCAAGVGAPHIRQRLYWVADSGSGGREVALLDARRGSAADGIGQAGVAGSHRECGGLADSSGGPLGCRELGLHSERGCDTRSAVREEQSAGGLGDASSKGREGRQPELQQPEETEGRLLAGPGCDCGVADSTGDLGGSGQLLPQRGPQGRDADRSDGAERLGVADAAGARCDGSLPVPEGDSRDAARVLVSGADSPWGRYIWIPCADGKWRRIKPGIVPLVDVVPDRVVRRSDPSQPFDAENSGEARRMRLKGYGNAISPTLAADFIRACCP